MGMKKQQDIPSYVKETAESRKKRVRESGNRYLTSSKASKKVYNRKDKSWQER